MLLRFERCVRCIGIPVLVFGCVFPSGLEHIARDISLTKERQAGERSLASHSERITSSLPSLSSLKALDLCE